VADDDRRCPSCGALVAPDAPWCGQCFASLLEPEPQLEPEPEREPEPEPEPKPEDDSDRTATETAPPDERRDQPGEAFWPCTVCGEQNPIVAEVCRTCGTPFAVVMRGPGERPTMNPTDAMVRSLLFPGLGHAALGYGLDGFARGALFAVSFGTALLVAMLGLQTAATLLSFLALLATAIGVYVLSALEARRVAEGGSMYVESKVLLWVLVGVMFLSIGLVTFAVVSAGRG
jgi:ribosomal protein L40E